MCRLWSWRYWNKQGSQKNVIKRVRSRMVKYMVLHTCFSIPFTYFARAILFRYRELRRFSLSLFLTAFPKADPPVTRGQRIRRRRVTQSKELPPRWCASERCRPLRKVWKNRKNLKISVTHSFIRSPNVISRIMGKMKNTCVKRLSVSVNLIWPNPRCSGADRRCVFLWEIFATSRHYARDGQSDREHLESRVRRRARASQNR